MNSCNSTAEWIKKLYIYTMEYYSAIGRNAFESVLVKWMNLEPVIQSEVREKQISYCIYRESKKMLGEHICWAGIEMQA